MAIKTVSLEVDAYALLVRARLHPRESFSNVVRRARWDQTQYTGAALAAYLRERSTRYLTLTAPSLQALARVAGRQNTGVIRSSEAGLAEVYVVDLSMLLQVEMEVAALAEGVAMRFIANKPESVFRVSVITHGEFLTCLTANDAALGSQILGRFEMSNLSSDVAGLYAVQGTAQAADANSVQRADNHLWVGCTAVTQNAPLLTQRPEWYAGIAGLHTIAL